MLKKQRLKKKKSVEWITIIDFTKIKKGGVSIGEIMKRL